MLGANSFLLQPVRVEETPANPAGMGLKNFSRQVWLKVAEKKTTDYNEVSCVYRIQFDCLLCRNRCMLDVSNSRFCYHWPALQVAEEMLQEIKAEASNVAPDRAASSTRDLNGPGDAKFDERNVRRRVYDALNVLMAVGVISKDKSAKTITWRGMPARARDEADYLEVRDAMLAHHRIV